MSKKQNPIIQPSKIGSRTTRAISQSQENPTFFKLDSTGKQPETIPGTSFSEAQNINKQIDIIKEKTIEKQIDSTEEQINRIRQLEVALQEEQTENIKLLDSVFNLEKQVTDPQNQNPNPNNIETMAVTLTDAILAIPVFKGEKKELETFVNTCDVYMDLMANENKPHLFRIIKTKITGEALSKISPISELADWPAIKAKLKLKVYKKVSFEFAQEDLNNITQNKEETIEQYGNRMKSTLRNLNESISDIADIGAEMSILRRVNEKQAISKFQQNLRNNNVRVLVSASSKETLDE